MKNWIIYQRWKVQWIISSIRYIITNLFCNFVAWCWREQILIFLSCSESWSPIHYLKFLDCVGLQLPYFASRFRDMFYEGVTIENTIFSIRFNSKNAEDCQWDFRDIDFYLYVSSGIMTIRVVCNINCFIANINCNIHYFSFVQVLINYLIRVLADSDLMCVILFNIYMVIILHFYMIYTLQDIIMLRGNFYVFL